MYTYSPKHLGTSVQNFHHPCPKPHTESKLAATLFSNKLKMLDHSPQPKPRPSSAVIGQESQSWSAAWLGAVWRGWKVKDWSY